jgi:hypothetical protein
MMKYKLETVAAMDLELSACTMTYADWNNSTGKLQTPRKEGFRSIRGSFQGQKKIFPVISLEGVLFWERSLL